MLSMKVKFVKHGKKVNFGGKIWLQKPVSENIDVHILLVHVCKDKIIKNKVRGNEDQIRLLRFLGNLRMSGIDIL